MTTYEDLDCVLYVDCEANKDRMVKLVLIIVDGKIDTISNVISPWGEIYIEENDDYDRSKCSDEEYGFIYYPYMLEIGPLEDQDPDQDGYISALSKFILELRKKNCKVVASCDFEDRLPRQ